MKESASLSSFLPDCNGMAALFVYSPRHGCTAHLVLPSEITVVHWYGALNSKRYLLSPSRASVRLCLPKTQSELETRKSCLHADTLRRRN